MIAELSVQVGAASAEKEPQPVSVELLSEEGSEARYRVRIGEREQLFNVRPVEATATGASYSLLRTSAGSERGGAQVMVDVDGNAPDFRVTVSGGEAIPVQVSDRRARTHAGPGATAVGELRAVMPGKVVKVLCKPGDTITAGQGVMVIEAMKMENELRTPAAGKVVSISVREGQTVEGGQILVVLSPP